MTPNLGNTLKGNEFEVSSLLQLPYSPATATDTKADTGVLTLSLNPQP